DALLTERFLLRFADNTDIAREGALIDKMKRLCCSLSPAHAPPQLFHRKLNCPTLALGAGHDNGCVSLRRVGLPPRFPAGAGGRDGRKAEPQNKGHSGIRP